MGRKAIDLVGQMFGNLIVLERDLSVQGKRGKAVKWLCRCTCGSTCSVSSNNLLRGTTKSCGCYRKNRVTTHDESNTKLYYVWRSMKARCYVKSTDSYSLYGERGISVCDEWKNNYESFRDWALNNGYREGLSIDRIDPNDAYCPENCRWVTAKEQANNTRRNRYIEYEGCVYTVSQLAEKLGISYHECYRKFKEESA